MNEFLGENINIRNLSPDTLFLIDLTKSYDFLDNFISRKEFDEIKNNLDKFNFKNFKNPSLILISFIAMKQSLSNKQQLLDPSTFKSIYNNQNILPLIKENNISQYDILRYARFIQLFIPELFSL